MTTERAYELTYWAARWLSARTASRATVDSYLRDIGLPYVLATLDEHAARRITEQVAAETGVRVPVHRPQPTATFWHLSWLVYCLRHGVDPWSSDTCHLVELWGRELAGTGDTPDHVWQTDTRQTQPPSAAFCRRRAAVVRSYSRYHYGVGLAACSIVDVWSLRSAGVPAEPEFREPVDELEPADLARVQLAADFHVGQTLEQELAAAVVATLVATGCRAVEIHRADVVDYDRSARHGPRIRLMRKGRRRDPRWLPVGDEAGRRIERWLLARPDLEGRTAHQRVAAARDRPHRTPLFTAVGGSRGMGAWVRQHQEGHPGRLSTRALWSLLRRVCDRSRDPRVRELGTWIHPHAIRAAVITQLFDDGHSATAIQAFAGHSSLSSTARYDRHRRDRHLPAAATALRTQATAIQEARRAALRRSEPEAG